MSRKHGFTLVLVAGLLVSGMVLLAPHPSLSAEQAGSSTAQVTLYASADSTISSVNPTTNYGLETTLDVALAGRAYLRTLLRFDLGTAIPPNAVIDSARLELYLLGSSGELRVQFVAANLGKDWVESGISEVTWNNQPPAVDPTVPPFWVSATLSDWQSWDVTPIVQAWLSSKNFGLLLRAADDAPDFRRTFASRNCLGRDCGVPRLVVDYSLPPTATATPPRVTDTPTASPTVERPTDTPTLTPIITRVTLTPPPTRTPTNSPTNTLTPTQTKTPVTTDLWITALEVTQGIQDLDNTVPLVARKRTYVRAHVKSNGGTYPDIRGEFAFGHSVGPPTGRIPADNPNSRITVKASPDRGEVGDSFYIEIPPQDLVEGTLYCHFYLNPDHELPEADYDNNYATVALGLNETPQVKLKLYHVRYYSNGQWQDATNTDMIMMVSWLRRAYPIRGVNWVMRQLSWTHVITPGLAGCGAVNNHLTADRLLDGNPPEWRYYALVTDKGGWMRGCSVSIPGYVGSGPTGTGTWGWDFDGSYGDWYGAHELGHCYGRSHTQGTQPPPCGGTCNQEGCAGHCGCEGGAVLQYPDGRIGGPQSNPNRYYGWDTEKRVVYSPDWRDLMTYCPWEWVSITTYSGIRLRLIIEGAAAGQAQTSGAEAQEYLAVFGLANLTQGTAELGTLLRWQTAGEPPTPSADWVLALRGSGGATLASYPFTPKPDTEAAEGEDLKASILETVPWVDGTTRVVILYRGGEVAGRDVSAHTPTVQVTYPNGGEVLSGSAATVTWSGNDADGDALTYAVQYSADGGAHWETVAVEIKETQLEVLLSELPGSETALFRVIVSDGVNTGQDESNGVCTVQRKAPQAFIISPDAGSQYSLGQQVMLVGEGYDAEDGSLPDGGLVWSSDLQGTLGSGIQLAITSLQEGKHIITLRATDSDGQSGSATVTIHVGVSPPTIYLPIVLKRW